MKASEIHFVKGRLKFGDTATLPHSPLLWLYLMVAKNSGE